MTSLFDDITENSTNELILSQYGYYPVFIFRGTDKFIEKITNLVVNYSILGSGKIKKLQDGYNAKFVLAPEDRILSGIKSCFRAEIILNHDLYNFNYNFQIKDEETAEFILTWDEKKLDSLALNMTAKFWVDHVKKINLFEDDTSTKSNYDEMYLGRICENNRLTEI